MGDAPGHMIQGSADASGGRERLGESLVTTNATYAPVADLLRTLEKSVEDLRGLISCRICIRPMYEPYIIACGHTFCYSCLAQWFSNHHTNKTCPDCRTKVLQQPAPAYLVREMTQLFISRVELMPFGERTEDHEKCQTEEARIVEQDRLNMDRRIGGLFRGSFTKTSRNQPILRDDEDGVNRCPNCGWELEDGVCNSCGASYGSDGEAYSNSTLSLSSEYDSDIVTQHLEDASDNLDTDDEEELAALIEMNEDISPDGDGHSVHADYASMTGNATFGRADAQGQARQIRHPDSLNTTFRHRYAPSMLSDVATHDENDSRNELMRFSDASDVSDASDEDTGSLVADFLDDKFDESVTDDERVPSYSPILSDEDNSYSTQSRDHSVEPMGHSDNETLSSGYAADHQNAGDDDRDSESNESRTASSPSHRGQSREISRPSIRRRHVWSVTSPDPSDEGTPNPNPRPSRLNSRRARPAQRSQPGPIEIRSNSGSPLPQRSRKRRYVVDDRSSNDGSNSDVNISRSRKRKGSSSGSMTVEG